jgi:hypothetical protein
LFLYDVTGSSLEGAHNALGAFGYGRDGKRGTRQIVIGLLADSDGARYVLRKSESEAARVRHRLETGARRLQATANRIESGT